MRLSPKTVTSLPVGVWQVVRVGVLHSCAKASMQQSFVPKDAEFYAKPLAFQASGLPGPSAALVAQMQKRVPRLTLGQHSGYRDASVILSGSLYYCTWTLVYDLLRIEFW